VICHQPLHKAKPWVCRDAAWKAKLQGSQSHVLKQQKPGQQKATLKKLIWFIAFQTFPSM